MPILSHRSIEILYGVFSVAQTFQSAGSGDFPVPRSGAALLRNLELEKQCGLAKIDGIGDAEAATCSKGVGLDWDPVRHWLGDVRRGENVIISAFDSAGAAEDKI